jgi:hypothetical protein
MLQLVGSLIAVLVGLLFFVNGSFMLVSPRAYFKLPSWLAPKGAHINEKRYGSGWGVIELRILGAIFVGVTVWVVYDAFLRGR